MEVSTAIEAIRAIEKATDGLFVITWSIEDVQMQATEMGRPLTLEQARRVLEMQRHYYDNNLGVTWESLEHWIGKVLQKSCPSL